MYCIASRCGHECRRMKHILESPALDDGADTALLASIRAAQGSLSTFEHCPLRADALFGLLVCLALFDTRIAASFIPSRRETSVLLDSSGNRPWPIGTLTRESGAA